MPSAETLAALPLTLGQLRAIGDQDPLHLNAGFSAPISSFEPQGYSDYNALTVNFKKRLSKDLQYQAAYTWSHLIDNSTAEVASTFLTPRRAEDFFNLSNEKASSALDRRQRFTLSLLYTLNAAAPAGGTNISLSCDNELMFLPALNMLGGFIQLDS
jgi:hypothetical protein